MYVQFPVYIVAATLPAHIWLHSCPAIQIRPAKHWEMLPSDSFQKYCRSLAYFIVPLHGEQNTSNGHLPPQLHTWIMQFVMSHIHLDTAPQKPQQQQWNHFVMSHIHLDTAPLKPQEQQWNHWIKTYIKLHTFDSLNFKIKLILICFDIRRSSPKIL